MANSTPRITIRRARASDKKVVLDFCRHTWGEWGDFIDRVWDEWVNDKKGFFAVASLGKRPIGTAKLTVLNKREMWFEGLRVDPSFRGAGISHLLTGFLAREALKRGAETVRYATGAKNFASLHIGKSWGLRRVGRYSILSASCDGRRRDVLERVSDTSRALEAITGLGQPAQRQPGRQNRRGRAGRDKLATEQILRRVKSSPFTAAMTGLASEGWTFFQVDRDFIADSLKKQELYIAMGSGEATAAQPKQPVARQRKTAVKGRFVASAAIPLGILIALPERDEHRLLVKLVADFRRDAFGDLLSGSRRLAYRLGLPRVRLIVPATRTMLNRARTAGFKEEHEGFYHVVLETRLGADRTRTRIARLADRYL